ncbi:MAG: TauD/TfdA family dioxygenase [Parvularculaceae bacterium]
MARSSSAASGIRTGRFSTNLPLTQFCTPKRSSLWRRYALCERLSRLRGLSDEMKRVLCSLTALHSAERGYGAQMQNIYAFLENMSVKTGGEASTRLEHPLVRTHPVTKRKTLYVNPVYTVGIKGMHPEEAAPILAFLNDHMTHENFTCRFRWTPGSRRHVG